MSAEKQAIGAELVLVIGFGHESFPGSLVHSTEA